MPILTCSPHPHLLVFGLSEESLCVHDLNSAHTLCELLAIQSLELLTGFGILAGLGRSHWNSDQISELHAGVRDAWQ